MKKSNKFSRERLDCCESIAAFLKIDPTIIEMVPACITNKQLVEWERACTNPEGFRQLRPDEKSHINKSLPLNAKGPRGTVLRYPQWMREYTLSKGVYDLREIYRLYNESVTPATSVAK
jgi:hypothetical protein